MFMVQTKTSMLLIYKYKLVEHIGERQRLQFVYFFFRLLLSRVI
jgi:hypothetical protein